MDLLLHEDKRSHEYALLALCNFFISSQLRRSSRLIGRGVKTSSSLTEVFITVICSSLNILYVLCHIKSTAVYFPKHGHVNGLAFIYCNALYVSNPSKVLYNTCHMYTLVAEMII